MVMCIVMVRVSEILEYIQKHGLPMSDNVPNRSINEKAIFIM